MRTCLVLSVLLSLAHSDHAMAGPSDSLVAGEFILNYDAPESPAFVALGMTPANILRASVAKPAAATLLSQFTSGAKIDNGVGLDFCPYFVFGGRLKNIVEYRESGWRRLVANTQLSFATVEDTSAQGDLRFGVGIRATLFDAHDPLRNDKLGNDIDDALVAAATKLPVESDEEVLPIGTYANLKEVYSQARDRVRTSPGSAMSVGWAMSGRLRGAVARSDSIDSEQHTVWLSYRYSFGGGLDLLALAQTRACKECHPTYRSGIAVRSNARTWDFSGELFFDSIRGDALSGKVGLALNGELRLVGGLGLIAALTTEPITNAGGVDSRIRMRSSIRWNAGQ